MVHKTTVELCNRPSLNSRANAVRAKQLNSSRRRKTKRGDSPNGIQLVRWAVLAKLHCIESEIMYKKLGCKQTHNMLAIRDSEIAFQLLEPMIHD